MRTGRYLRIIVTMLMLLMYGVGEVWAQEQNEAAITADDIFIQIMPSGKEGKGSVTDATYGSVSANVGELAGSGDNQYYPVTLTVTPAGGYQTKTDLIMAEKMIDPDKLPDRRAPGTGTLTVTGPDNDWKEHDGSTGYNYTFNLPSDFHGAYVTVTFVEILSGENQPTQISTFSELQNISADGNYILTRDIDASGLTSSLGTFSGTLDGNFHKIYNLSKPLFSSINGGTVKNLMLEDVNITTGTNVGAIACEVTGTSTNIASIYNCGIMSGSVKGSDYVGGLVGQLGQPGNTNDSNNNCYARVINCFSYADVVGGTDKGGIVGYNCYASKSGDVRTMVMNCMFYGDIAEGDNISPIFGGELIDNLKTNTETGLNTFNYYRYESEYSYRGRINKYNNALAAKEERLNRFEFYRQMLNSNKKLAASYATGSADNANQKMAKWVLETADKSIVNPLPYPILKPQGKYSSIINYDTDHAIQLTLVNNQPKEEDRNKGGKIGTLEVTISAPSEWTNAPSDAKLLNASGTEITTSRTIPLVRTDKDTLHYNYNYDKVQLPYYNDYGTKNYTGNKVVTGWKITSVTIGSGDDVATQGYFKTGSDIGDDKKTPYNFADRKSYAKDLYSAESGDYSGRVFSQGAYFDVPYGATAITIEPYWGNAVYVGDANLDVVYTNGYGSPTGVAGTQYTNGSSTFNGEANQKIYTSISNALGAKINNITILGGSTVYDNAIVLVGNLHLNDVPSNVDTHFTIMSVDENHDNEPDYSLICYHDNRKAVSPIRFDFLNVMGTAQAQKPHNAAKLYNVSIFNPKGWFEVTNTCLIHFVQFEYDNGSKNAAPLIFLGGTFDQFTSSHGYTSTATAFSGTTQYIHVGSNVYFKNFNNGCHGEVWRFTPHIPISVTGGDYGGFYLSGIYQPNAIVNEDNAECYISGGRFKEVAGAAQQQIDGDVLWQIYDADIENFYGGGINAAKPITGHITTNIYNSHVTTFCGGPKFGNMQQESESPITISYRNANDTPGSREKEIDSDRIVTTIADGCTFGNFYGAGYGGTSFNRITTKDGSEGLTANFSSWETDYTGVKGKYVSANNGIATNFDYEFFVWSTGQPGGRFYVEYASLSTAQTNNVTSTLTNCIVNKNVYGGGKLGRVKGTAKTTLDGCTVKGDVFGAGYSASLDPVKVRNGGFGAIKEGDPIKYPSINMNSGMFEDGEFSKTTDYIWKEHDLTNNATNIITENGINYIYTPVHLNNLGQVDYSELKIQGNTSVVGSVYGGGEESDVTGNTIVNMIGGTVNENVYGGGKGVADNFTCNKAMVGIEGAGVDEVNYPEGYPDGNTRVSISNGTVKGNVYGGGEVGRVEMNTSVTIGVQGDDNSMPTIQGSVFGGGAGLKTHGYSALVRGNPTVTVQGKSTVRGSVYGGGEIASVARYNVAKTNDEGAQYGVLKDMPYALRTNNSGYCTVIVRDKAEIGPETPNTEGNVFGAGKGILPEEYDYVSASNYTGDTYNIDEHMPKRMVLNAERTASIWQFFDNEDDYITFIKTLALASQTDVTIEGNAKVKGSVYGGSESGFVQFDTKVTVKGGTIGTAKANLPQGVTMGAVYGNVYGGGKGDAEQTGADQNYVAAGWVKGNTKIKIENGTILHNVYGGGAYGTVGEFDYDTSGMPTGRRTYIITEGENAGVHNTTGGNTEIYITGGEIGTDGDENGMIFGSSRGDAGAPGSIHDKLAWVYDTHVAIGDTAANATVTTSTPLIKGSIYGGGENGHNFRSAYVRINGGTIGITSGAPIGTYTSGGASYPYRGNVYGGGCGTDMYDNNTKYNPIAGIVQGNARINMTGGLVVHNMYGAGAMGSVGTATSGGVTTIDISGGTVGVSGTVGDGNVFGAARGSADATSNEYALVRDHTTVNISGGTVKGNVYGGGELGCVGRYKITSDMRNFYWTDETLAEDQTTYLYNKTGVCNVTITGGEIGTGGEMSADGTFTNGNVYGAGKGKEDTFWCEKGIVYKSNVSIGAGTVKGNVYGGGEVGRVETDTKVKIALEHLADGTSTYCTKNDGTDAGSILAAGTNVVGKYIRTGEEGSYTYTLIEDDEPIVHGNVFGAGAGKETHGYSALVRGNTEVTVQGEAKVKKNVYGGGQIAAVGKYYLVDAAYLAAHPESKLEIGMPYSLVNENLGVCRVTIKDNATIGDGGTGHVFGAGKGKNPSYYRTVETLTDTTKMPKRMMSYNDNTYNNEANNPLKGLWGYIKVYPANYTGKKYVWEYFNTRDKYHTFLQTLALATQSVVSIEGRAKVNGSVYGGSESGFVQHNTSVTVQGSSTIGVNGVDGEDETDGNVFGGGLGLDFFAEAGRMNGNSTVNINGGTVKRNVYGGGSLGPVGNYFYVVDENSGSKTYTWTEGGTCNVTIDALDNNTTTIKGNVFGAGKGSADTFECEPAMVLQSNVTIANGTIEGNVYGGGEVGRVDKNTKVKIALEHLADGTSTYCTQDDGTDAGEVLVAGTNVVGKYLRTGEAEHYSYTLIEDDEPRINGYVFGAGAGKETHGYSALVRGNADVTIQGKAQIGKSVFGGGELASVGRFQVIESYPRKSLSGGTCSVTIKDEAQVGTGSNGGDVFGACKGVEPDFAHNAGHWMADNQLHQFTGTNAEADYLNFLKTLALTSNTKVTIDGSASINGSVYGGGQRGITLASVKVNMIGGSVSNDVYGGGALANTNTENWDDTNNTLTKYHEEPGLTRPYQEKKVSVGESVKGLYTRSGDQAPYTYTEITEETATAVANGKYYEKMTPSSVVGLYTEDNGEYTLLTSGTAEEGTDYYRFTNTIVNLLGGTIGGNAYGGGLGRLAADAVTAVYTAVEDGTTLTDGKTYYTSSTGSGEFTADGTEVANGTNYFELTTPASDAVSAVEAFVYGDIKVNLNGLEVANDMDATLLTAITGADDTSKPLFYDSNDKFYKVKTTKKGAIVNQIFGCNNLNGSPKAHVKVHVFATQNKDFTTGENPLSTKYPQRPMQGDKEHPDETYAQYLSRLAAAYNGRTAVTTKIAAVQTASPSDNDYDDKVAALNAVFSTLYDVKAVYGGGNLAAYMPVDVSSENETLKNAARTEVIIDGCDLTSIETVYGGGNAASVPASYVRVNGTQEIEELFGGGNGKDNLPDGRPNPGAHVGYTNYSTYNSQQGKWIDNNDALTPEDRKNSQYSYGSGITTIEVTGGLIHATFGGSNTKGNIREKAESTYEDAEICPMRIDETYGGGKDSPMDAEIDMVLDCVKDMDMIFGGSKNADVDNNITLNITNGTFQKVFGGNNTSGAINGAITVNIEERGCQPIEIEELYLGGYLAPYSVYGYKKTNGVYETIDVDGIPQRIPLKKIDSGASTTPYNDPRLNVISATRIGNIFGGGYKATVVGNPYVNVNMTTGKVKVTKTPVTKTPVTKKAVTKRAKEENDNTEWIITEGGIDYVYVYVDNTNTTFYDPAKVEIDDSGESPVYSVYYTVAETVETVYDPAKVEKVTTNYYIYKDAASYYDYTKVYPNDHVNSTEFYVYKDGNNNSYENDAVTDEKSGTLELGTIGNIYGGGNEADIYGSTNVEIGTGRWVKTWKNGYPIYETEYIDTDNKVKNLYYKEKVHAVYYTKDECNEYNATLDGYIASGKELTQKEADAVNNALTLTGTDDAFSKDDKLQDTNDYPYHYAYNATLAGARKTSDVKTPAVWAWYTYNTATNEYTIPDPEVTTAPTPTRNRAQITGNVFGGGKGVADTFTCEKAMVGIDGAGINIKNYPDGYRDGNTNVTIENGTINGNVYGGGEIGRVEMNSTVTIGFGDGVATGTPTSAPEIKGDVFGGGAGVKTHGYSALVRGNPTVTVQGNAKVRGSVYGGGEIASVARYKVKEDPNDPDAPVGWPMNMPYALKNANSGFCTVTIRGYAEIGPENAMQMMTADGAPDDAGHVFGAGKGILPEVYTYTDDDHRPSRMVLNANKTASIWEYFTSEAAYIGFIETLALASETNVTIGDHAFVKGSVYGGSMNGIVQYDTHVTIEDNCQIGAGFVQMDDEGNYLNTKVGVNRRYTDAEWTAGHLFVVGDPVFYDNTNSENPTLKTTLTDDETALRAAVGSNNYTTSLPECASWPYQSPYEPYDLYNLDANNNNKPKAATDGHTFYGNVFGGGSGYYPYKQNPNWTKSETKTAELGRPVDANGYSDGVWLRSAGLVRGNTTVDITGGHILTSVYGGNEQTDVEGSCTVNMSGGTLGVPRTLGQIAKHPVTCYLFGAGKGDPRINFNIWTNVKSVDVNITGGWIYGSVFGGGEDGHVQEDVTMTIGKAAIGTEGEDGYKPASGPKIGTWGTSYVEGNVFGGGRGFTGDAQTAGTVGGNINLTISGGEMLGSIYGGGRLASVGTSFVYPTLEIEENGSTSTIANPSYGNFVEDNVILYYTKEECDLYNPTITGYIPAETTLTAQQADAYNAATGASKKPDIDKLSVQEALDYNSQLVGYRTIETEKINGEHSHGHITINISGGTIGNDLESIEPTKNNIPDDLLGKDIKNWTENDWAAWKTANGITDDIPEGLSPTKDNIVIAGITDNEKITNIKKWTEEDWETWKNFHHIPNTGFELYDSVEVGGTKIYKYHASHTKGGNVFGGSMGRLELLNNTRNPIWPKMAQVKTTAVNIYGKAVIKRSVYGGGELGTVRDNAYVTIGGIKNADVDENGVVDIDKQGGGTVNWDVFGGGYGSEDRNYTVFTVKEPKANVTNPNPSIPSHYEDHEYAFTPMQFAGGVGKNTYVHIVGGYIKKSVYGGGEMASVGIINSRVTDVTTEPGKDKIVVAHEDNTNTWTIYSHMIKHWDEKNEFALSWPFEFEYMPTFDGATHVHVTGGRIGAKKDDDIGTDNGDVYGAGKGLAGDYKDYVFCANVGSTDVRIEYEDDNNNLTLDPKTYKINGDCISGAVYGGGENGHVMGNAKLTLENGLVGHSIYGGGSGKGKFSTRKLLKIGADANSTADSDHYTRDIYSITAGKVFGNTEVEMTGGYVVRNVYGGGNMGSVGKGNYAGGPDDYSAAGYGEKLTGENNLLWDGNNKFSQAFLNSGKCTVTITGGTVGYIDETNPSNSMYPWNSTASLPYGNVFGGCRGESAPNLVESPRYLYSPEFFVGYANETNVTIGTIDQSNEDAGQAKKAPRIYGSVYGGGQDGHIRRDTYVTINSGEIGMAFTYENRLNKLKTIPEGTTEDAAKNIISDLDNLQWLARGNVYGAGSGIGKYKYDFNYDGDFGDVFNYNNGRTTVATNEEDHSTSAGSVTRFTTVNINGGIIHRNVYGGGSLSTVGAPKIPPINYDPYRKGDTAENHGEGKQSLNQVNIAGTIGTPDGYGNDNTFKYNPVYGGEVYGASRGDVSLGSTFSNAVWTEVNLLPGARVQGNVFGGGDSGPVKEDSEVNVGVTFDIASTAIEDDAMNIPRAGGDNTINVTSNATWEVKSSASWLTVRQKSGDGNGTITVTATANNGEGATERTATITFSAPGQTKTISVTQAGN